MKRLLLFAVILGLITGCAFAQKPTFKPKYERINPSTGKTLYYSELIKRMESPKYHVVPDRLKAPDAEDKLFQLIRPDPPTYDSMPILKPTGYHHAIVIKPDTSIDFKLIVRKP